MKTATLGLALLALATAQSADEAARLAESGDLAAAQREYQALLQDQPESDTLHYNLGTVLLNDRRYDEARPHLERAVVPDSPQESAASYNLGNTDLEPAFADSTLAERDARLRRAIEAYKQALLVDPDDQDAKWNLELAQRLLEGEPPPQSGGGGGGGGGDQGPPSPGEQEPSPTPSGGRGNDPDVAESQAESLLREAQQRELEVQRDRLQKPLPPEGIRP